MFEANKSNSIKQKLSSSVDRVLQQNDSPLVSAQDSAPQSEDAGASSADAEQQPAMRANADEVVETPVTTSGDGEDSQGQITPTSKD